MHDELIVECPVTEQAQVETIIRQEMERAADLTVPLARYYANNKEHLPAPFKALQMGNVYRADNPQKGRFRQFVQCDIDILGDATQTAEITLISSTAGVLRKLGFDNFTIRINDRRMLKLCAEACGFAPEEHDKVFIILDKMDKIGLDGVKNELLTNGFAEEAVDKYLKLFEELDKIETSNGKVEFLADALKDVLDPEVHEGLLEIMDSVSTTKAADFDVVFDVSENAVAEMKKRNLKAITVSEFCDLVRME